METSTAVRAEKYYKLIGEKKAEEIREYLDPDVEFCAPLGTVKGREGVIKATFNFMNSFESLTVKAKFGSEDQAMIVYEVNIPGISKDFPGASWLTFRNGKIVRIQLFYDGSRVSQKREEIFRGT